MLVLLQEAAKEHDSCINNLHTSLTAIGHPLTDDPDNYLPPSPFNLWMAVSLKNEGSQLSWDPPAKVSLSPRHSAVAVLLLLWLLLLLLLFLSLLLLLFYCTVTAPSSQGAGPP